MKNFTLDSIFWWRWRRSLSVFLNFHSKRHRYFVFIFDVIIAPWLNYDWSSGSSSRIEGEPINMKSMYLPSVAIFLWHIFTEQGGGWPPQPPSPIRYWTDKTITRTKAECFSASSRLFFKIPIYHMIGPLTHVNNLGITVLLLLSERKQELNGSI